MSDITNLLEDLVERIDRDMKSKHVSHSENKVFYRVEEWSGWRFYRKAVAHGDWRSLWGHIKSHFV